MGVVKTKVRKKHLWVVLSDTVKHNGYGIIVNISTDSKRTRKECPLSHNEHPWLCEPASWVCYADAVLVNPEKWIQIQKGIKTGFIIPKEDSSMALVNKIIAGAKISAAQPHGGFPKDYLIYLD